jgi:hypothetical protein
MAVVPHRRRVVLGELALLSLAALSCDSPVAPRGAGERVPVGRVIEDAMSGDSVRRYSFAVTPGGEYAVFGEALQGAVQLVVVDSVHQQLVGSVFADTGSAPLEENTTPAFFTGSGGAYLISIRPVPAGTAARFRFEVFQVNTAPETHAARFAIGDTVTGETIDPSVDIDAFVARGDSGQEVVCVMQALGSVGSGVLSLAILDSLGANSLVGSTFADGGNPNPQTTGRLMFPATRDYQFRLGAVTGTFPRYRGPYRFWSYAIDRAPEHQPAAVAVGSEVRGESIDRAGDVDEFTFQATAGVELNAFLHSSRPFQLVIAAASGAILAGVSSGGPDTGLFRAGTGRFQLTQAGTYVVRVTGLDDRDMADTGSYRFLLYPIDRRPESIGAGISRGDTITGESIDRPGDIDELTFTGTAGEEFNAFLQATGPAQAVLELSVLDSNGTVLTGTQSVGSDTSLLLQQTGRFTLSTSGTYRLRVTGAGSIADRDTGPYRLFLYPVNRPPELLPDSIRFGDSASGEAIEVPGDVDEFRVTVPDSSGANLVAYLEAGATAGRLDVSLVDSGGHDVAAAQPTTAGAFGHSGALLLPPGTYILRVQGGSVVGGYRVWIYKFRLGPEIASDTIAIGDTISAEALDPPGDVDKFTMFGRRGDHINVALQGLEASGEGGFLAVFSASDQLPPISLVFSPLLSDSLGTYESKRIDLTATGWYHLAISAASSPTLLSERGPYQVAVTSLGTAPEHAGVAVSPGDSVTNEAIDYLGDWDEFTLTGTPGQMLAILTQKLSGTGYPRLAVLDTTTGDTLASVVPQLGEKATARFRIPLSGQLEIAVFQPGVFDFVGAYRLVAQPVNPAPENVPAIYVLGDTIRGEAVFPKADVDDFTSTATPGDTLMPSYRLTANPVPNGELITLQVIDPTTGAVLVGAGVSLIAASPDFFSPGRFIVPAGGAYLIRIHGGGTFGDEVGTAPYEFFVRRAP